MNTTTIIPGATTALAPRWPDLKSVRYDLIVTALTPIVHAQATIGNDSILMTERVLDIHDPSGEPEDVPCLTGNTLRHALRDALCRMTLRVLDVEIGSLSIGAQHFLLSGGALGKQAKTIDLEGYRKLIEAFPFLPLFGGGIGHALVPGKLEVGYGILMCRQNAWRIKSLCPKLGDLALPDAQSLRERRISTRSDSRRTLVGKTLSPAHAMSAPSEDEDEGAEQPMQMLAGYEAVCAGAKFLWQVGVQLATDVEHAAMLCALVSLSVGGRIGAKGGTGHGRILLHAVGESGDHKPLSTTIEASEHLDPVVLAEQIAGSYVARVRESRTEILTFLAGLK